MAQIGLKYAVYAKVASETSGSAPTYSKTDNGIIGKLISADVTINTNDNPLYADNVIVENDATFSDGSIKLATADITLAVRAKLLGGAYTEATTGENPTPAILIEGGNDTAPYVGVGYCKTGMANNVKYFEGTWYYKTQFKPFGESAKTKEKSIEWNTPEIEGTIMTVEGYSNDAYREVANFTTESACIAWLNTKAGITAD